MAIKYAIIKSIYVLTLKKIFPTMVHRLCVCMQWLTNYSPPKPSHGPPLFNRNKKNHGNDTNKNGQ